MTFSAFLRQYEAQPPEKLDGYFPFHFEGMSEAELERARAMMVERGLQGDTTDLDGLKLIGDAETVKRLEEAQGLAAARGPRFDAIRRETLFVLTGDARHLAGLFTWIDSPDKEVQEFAAQALSRHRLPAGFAGPIIERLADGRHEGAAMALVEAWLATRGEPAGDLAVFQRNLPLIRSIVSARPDQRPAIMARA